MNQLEPRLLRRVNIILAVLLFAVSALSIGHFYQTDENNRQALNKETPPIYKETPPIYNEDISPVYSVKYPKDFFILYKGTYSLILAEKRLVDLSRLHIPTVRITIHKSIIPEDMELKTWLDGVTDPNDLYSNIQKSCADFQRLIAEMTGVNNYLDHCWFHQVSNIEETIISGLPALTFNSQSVTENIKHAIVRYQAPEGNNNFVLLFDIYAIFTSLSEDSDSTTEAYQMMLQTLQIKSPVNPY